MREIAEEEFRFPRGAGLLLRSGGAGFLVFAVGFVAVTLSTQRFDWSVAVASLFAAAVGAVMIAAGILRDRYVLRISSAGVNFGPGTDLQPWGRLAAFRYPRVRNELLVVDRAGQPVGKVPAALQHFDRAVLRLAEQMPLGGEQGSATRFQSDYGVAGWIAFLAILGVIWREFDPRNLVHLRGAGLLSSLAAAAFLLWKVKRSWRATGRTLLTVDAMGIRSDGRSGPWEARWGELAELRPRFTALGLRAQFELIATKIDGSRQRLPMQNTDLNGVLAAIRTFGGIHWTRHFVPPPEPPVLPLLRRKL